MNKISEMEHEIYENSNGILSKGEFKYLKFEKRKEDYIVTLVDDSNYEIIKGYGKSRIDAINDLHSNLL